MSDDIVDLAKRANAAFNAGEVEPSLSVYDEKVEFIDYANAPDQPRVIRGKDALREAWELWAAAFDELRVDVEEWEAVGDAVVCSAHWHGQGKASGIKIDLRQFDVYKFRDGKVYRAVLGLRSREEAQTAAEDSRA